MSLSFLRDLRLWFDCILYVDCLFDISGVCFFVFASLGYLYCREEGEGGLW